MLSGIILIELNTVGDSKAKEILKDVKNRLETISQVHQQMLHADDNPSIQVKNFFDNFIENIKDSIQDPTTHISKNISGDQEELPIRKAIPVALIANELITNAIKHARPPKNEPLKICFKVESNTNSLEFMVQDNGKEEVPDDYYKKPQSVGFKLVTLLSQQLDAEFNYSYKAGNRFSICIKLDDL
jgi:two-component sensor histidine kinase